MTITELLTNDEFFSAVKATLYVLMGLGIFVVFCLAMWLVARAVIFLYRQLREIKSFQQLAALFAQARREISRFVSGCYAAFCQFVQDLWWNYLEWKDGLWVIIKAHKVIIWTVIGVLIFASMPFWTLPLKMKWISILGVASVGAVLGMLILPFIAWRFRRLGFLKAVGVSLLAIPGGAWVSCLIMAMCFVMTSS